MQEWEVRACYSQSLLQSLFHLLLCDWGLSVEVFQLCSLFPMCPSVLGTAWDGFLLPKGVSSVCTGHCPRDTEVTTPLELPAADFGHDLALVLGGWAGLGTKGFVLPVPLAGKRNSPQRKACTRNISAGRDPGQEV